MTGQIRVLSKNEPTPAGFRRLDVTSANREVAHLVSPFFVGPVKTYAGMSSRTMENAWQFSKLYPTHAHPGTDSPSDAYAPWRNAGWGEARAQRRPMGRTKPLCSLWVDGGGRGVKLGYIAARKAIYVPLYERAVVASGGVELIQSMLNVGDNLALVDFDGYDHRSLGMSYSDVLNHERKIMGHAFALAALAEGTPMSQINEAAPATTVVNKRTCADYDVYIGRGSIWGNPFVMRKESDRAHVIAQYRTYFENNAELRSRVGELKGKKIACFCAPKACHGDILAEYANKA